MKTTCSPRYSLPGAALLLLAASVSPAPAATTFSVNDNSGAPDSGMYSPGGAFTLAITLTVSSPSAGYTLFFDTAAANAGFFSIGSFTLASASFPDATSGNGAQSFNTSNAGRAGFLSNPMDLGATTSAGTTAAAGSYLVENINFLIDPATAPGTYLLQTTPAAAGGRASGSTGGGPTFTFESAPSATYTITVVPEPSTWALLALGGGLLLCPVVARNRAIAGR